MIHEQNLDAPWIAPNAPTFKIGDRVRIRISGECLQERWVNENTGETGGHFPEEDGRTGTVCVWPEEWSQPANGHTVCVDFDKPIIHPPPFSEDILDGMAFAPNELELIASA